VLPCRGRPAPPHFRRHRRPAPGRRPDPDVRTPSIRGGGQAASARTSAHRAAAPDAPPSPRYGPPRPPHPLRREGRGNRLWRDPRAREIIDCPLRRAPLPPRCAPVERPRL